MSDQARIVVTGETLYGAREQASAALAAYFTGYGWFICETNAEAIITTGDGSVVAWEVEVRALREPQREPNG